MGRKEQTSSSDTDASSVIFLPRSLVIQVSCVVVLGVGIMRGIVCLWMDGWMDGSGFGIRDLTGVGGGRSYGVFNDAMEG